MSLRGRIVGLAATATLVLGCATAPAPETGAPGATLAGTSWTVETISGTAVDAAFAPTMTFSEDGTVAGSASCNQYSGPFRTETDRITIGDLQSTLMLCEGQVGAQEAAFLAALRAVQTWDIDANGNLAMAGPAAILAKPGIAGAPPSRDPAAGLGGTSWNLAEMGGTADFARIVPTVEFGADGSVSGFAGCNTFSGTYSVDGGAIVIGPLATTKIACERPAGAVEAAYLEALTGVATWSIEPDGQLLLGGTVPLRYTAG